MEKPPYPREAKDLWMQGKIPRSLWLKILCDWIDAVNAYLKEKYKDVK